MRTTRLRTNALAAILAASSMVACTSAGASSNGYAAPPVGATLAARATPLGLEIARLEDARSTGGGRLIELAAHANPRLRSLAVTALGRMPWPEEGAEVTGALSRALSDPEQEVRAAAAFALGLRGDPAAGDELLLVALDPGQRDVSPSVRARAIEAASKLERRDLHTQLMGALADPAAEVRREVIVASHRWPAESPGAAQVDRALIENLAEGEQAENVWLTLFALQRRNSEAGRSVFLEHARAKHALERVFSVRGLARIEPGAQARDALIRALGDRDERVAAEAALGLARQQGASALAALRRACEHKDSHVRRSAWNGLAAMIEANWERAGASAVADLDLSAWIDEQRDKLRRESSAAVRGAALEMAGLWVAAGVSGEQRPTTAQDAADFQGSVLTELGDEPEVRAGLARYWSRFPSAIAVPCLAFHAGDGDKSVAIAALEGLGRHATPQSRDLLHQYVHHDDNGIRLAAVLALAEMPAASDLEHLEFAFVESRGDIATEVRFNALRSAGAIEGERAELLLRRGLLAAEPFVRRTAQFELQRRTGELTEASSAAPLHEPRADPVAVAGVDFAVADENPTLEIVTNRGTLLFELFPAEAPNHVHSFLTLAAQGHYDGLRFHRVVPDFVIQGGDYRGDGNGGTTWRGSGSLRHEIGPRKYVRGSLGMPRNDDPDSGGSQIFVTHRPTPHLDGRYTIFGELRRGFEVLDAIEVGDTIRSIRRPR